MKVRHERGFVVGGVVSTEDGSYVALVGERAGDALAFRGAVEYGFGRVAATDVLVRAKARQRSPFLDGPRLREAMWLEPKLVANVSYAEVMNGRLRDPVYRGLVWGAAGSLPV